MANNKIRIRLKSFDHKILDASAEKIISSAKKSGAQVGPRFEPIMDEYLDYDKVMERLEPFTDWLANLYVNTLNVIHYMHDKYSYEALEMALHDRDVFRTMACGIAGLSVAADSLSAIKYAKVKTIRNEAGVAVDFEIEGDYPK